MKEEKKFCKPQGPQIVLSIRKKKLECCKNGLLQQFQTSSYFNLHQVNSKKIKVVFWYMNSLSLPANLDAFLLTFWSPSFLHCVVPRELEIQSCYVPKAFCKVSRRNGHSAPPAVKNYWAQIFLLPLWLNFKYAETVTFKILVCWVFFTWNLNLSQNF